MTASHPGYHVKFRHHVSLAFSWLRQFLTLGLFFMTTVLRRLGQVFGRMLLKLNLSDVFPYG